MAASATLGVVLNQVIDSEEYVDYYDESGNIAGFCTRSEADERNLTYPNVIVFIFTADKRVWIQKRSLSKQHYPGLWDTSACGGVAHTEEPELAAKRELLEEMGIESDLHFVEKFLNTFPSEEGSTTRSRMSYIFIGLSEVTPTGNDEVEAVAVFEVDELLQETKLHPEDFVPSFDIEFEKAVTAYELLAT